MSLPPTAVSRTVGGFVCLTGQYTAMCAMSCISIGTWLLSGWIGNGMAEGFFDLRVRAHQAMIEAGFRPDFPADVTREVQTMKEAAPANRTSTIRDLRAL